MNEQHTHFVSDIREFDLLSETDPSQPYFRLKVSVYDNCESSFLLESNFVDNAPLNDLKEVFNPLVTFLPCCSILFLHPHSH